MGAEYFSTENSPVIAELWYKIGSKEAELVSVSDAIMSFKKAVELAPKEAKYTEALAQAEEELALIHKKRKRKQKLTYATWLGIIVLIVGSVYLYKFVKENQAWETAQEQNTYSSFQRYIRTYPEGRFIEQAEESLWAIAIVENTISGFNTYLKNYPDGIYANDARQIKEQIFWSRTTENVTLRPRASCEL